MDLFRSLVGVVRVELTSADIEASLKVLNSSGITVYDAISSDGLTICFSVSRTDVRRLRAITKKRGDQVRFPGKTGVYWMIKQSIRRPVLIFGIMAVVLSTIYLPSRVLFVEVEGNHTLPTKKILEESVKCGIGFGASRREVRSEKVKNALLGAIPQLQWVGVNTQGCRAVISVRERTDLQEAPKRQDVSSIIAVRDGVIAEMTIVHGTPLCRVGQSVTEGQVLVSGYTDLGLCVRAEQAEGEVYARTRRKLEVIMPILDKIRTDRICRKRNYSFIIGKKRINIDFGSGILDATCDKMYSEYYMSLPGGFTLPVALAVEEFVWYDEAVVAPDPSSAEDILKNFSDDHLSHLMVAGRIEAAHEHISNIEGGLRLFGEYDCYEMIGKSRPEENIHNYENDRAER